MMRSDVHFAALRAAAKVAFSVASVALVEGCSSSDGTPADETDSNESAATLGGGSKKACEDDGPAKPSCDAVLASAFPEPGGFTWGAHAQTKDVLVCCDEELTNASWNSKYRWECCYAYDAAEGEPPAFGTAPLFQKHAMACTPWGPPVPPSMNRARRARPEIAAWIAKAVA